MSCGGSVLELAGRERTIPKTIPVHCLEDTKLEISKTDQKISSTGKEYGGSSKNSTMCVQKFYCVSMDIIFSCVHSLIKFYWKDFSTLSDVFKSFPLLLIL